MATKAYDIYFATYDGGTRKVAKGPYALSSFEVSGFLNRRPDVYAFDPDDMERVVEVDGWKAVLFHDQPAVVAPGNPALSVDQIAALPGAALTYLGITA